MRLIHSTDGRKPGSWIWAVGLTVMVAAAIAGPTWGSAQRRGAGSDARSLAERWGIEAPRLRSTARNHLLDLRFRIVDPDKAAALNAQSNQTFLHDPATGRRLGIPSTPKAGLLRSAGRPQRGRTYFALFSNPGHRVVPGNLIALVVGGKTVTALIVE